MRNYFIYYISRIRIPVDYHATVSITDYAAYYS